MASNFALSTPLFKPITEMDKEKQEEETNVLAVSSFVHGFDAKHSDCSIDTSDIGQAIKNSKKIIVINFPGSGLTSKKDDYLADATHANTKTKELFMLKNDPMEDCIFLTAVYAQKADLMIREYNADTNGTYHHATGIFNDLICPLLSTDFEKTKNNLQRLIFRGQCLGTAIIAELEKLLHNSLQQSNAFNEQQIKTLLSQPTALLSSPPLLIEKYPQYFNTTAIINMSDRTIMPEVMQDGTIKDNYGCKDLQQYLHAKTQLNPDMPLTNAKDILKPYKLPPIKIASYQEGNIFVSVASRGIFPKSYAELQQSIMTRKNMQEQDAHFGNELFYRNAKKIFKGHEFGLLCPKQRQVFSSSFTKAIKNIRQHTKSQKKEIADRRTYHLMRRRRKFSR